jgi:hypothetical protein
MAQAVPHVKSSTTYLNHSVSELQTGWDNPLKWDNKYRYHEGNDAHAWTRSFPDEISGRGMTIDENQIMEAWKLINRLL